MNNNNGSKHFLFEGSEDGLVPPSSLAVPKEALCVRPSFLSSLADDAWQKDPSQGATRESPLIVKPLESLRDVWVPGAAELVGAAQKGDPLVLPHNLELEEAVTILDFFGLPVDDPETINLDETNTMTQLRARMFLEFHRDYQKTVSDIKSSFLLSPALEKNFIFLKPHHRVEHINACNKLQFTTVNTERGFAWVQKESFRDKLVADLASAGFDVAWRHSYHLTTKLTVETGEPRNYGYGGSYGGGYGGRSPRYSPYDEDPDRRVSEDLHVLRAAVPEAEPISKRQRRS